MYICRANGLVPIIGWRNTIHWIVQMIKLMITCKSKHSEKLAPSLTGLWVERCKLFSILPLLPVWASDSDLTLFSILARGILSWPALEILMSKAVSGLLWRSSSSRMSPLATLSISPPAFTNIYSHFCRRQKYSGGQSIPACVPQAGHLETLWLL